MYFSTIFVRIMAKYFSDVITAEEVGISRLNAELFKISCCRVNKEIQEG